MIDRREWVPGRLAYVVLGSHRSGTSAMARALNLAGFGVMPTDLLPPHPTENPTGFWEPRPIVELNEDILRRAGGRWDCPPPHITKSENDVERAAALLLHQFSRSAAPVLKDPRISILLPLWREALARIGLHPIYVLVLRDPSDVAASLKARNGFDIGSGRALWRHYTASAEGETRGLDRILVSFDELLEDPRTVLAGIAEVAGRLGTTPKINADEAVRFLRLDLRHHRRARSDSRSGEQIEEEQIFQHLLATRAATPAAQATLDQLNHSPKPITEVRPMADEGRVRSDQNWLLVTGAPRSGTSFLRAMLNEHREIGLLQEYGLTELVRRIDAIVARPAPVSVDWDSEGDPHDAAFETTRAMYRDRPGRAAITRGGGDPKPEHFQDVAAGLFSGMFPDKTPKVIGDKMPISPDWENVQLLFERLPGFRIVAVIRNPADVVRSSLVRREATRRGRDTWPIRTVEEAVTQWVDAWHTVVAMTRQHDSAVLVVKYEDLCNQPQPTMDKVFAWLGLSPHVVSTPIAALPAHLALHTATEQETLERLLSPVIDAWPGSNVTELMTRFDTLSLPYLLGGSIRLSLEEATPYLISGFSFREEWGRWTDGPRAVLSIQHDAARGLLLVEISVLQAFVGNSEKCDVVVKCGWAEPRLFALGPDRSRIAFVTRAEESHDVGKLTVELLIVRPKRPDEAPYDSRALGLLIDTVRVSRLPDYD